MYKYVQYNAYEIVMPVCVYAEYGGVNCES